MTYLKAFAPIVLFIPLTAFSQEKEGIVKEDIEVSAQANVYFHEIMDTSMVPGGAGIPPIAIDVRGADYVTFDNVSGEVSCFGERDSTFYGADGGEYGESTSVYPGEYIPLSGINHKTKVMFLTGVFVSAYSGLDPQLPAIDFTEEEEFYSDKYIPAQNQVVYIGDGRKEDGTPQLLGVPTGAETLYIGFADCLRGKPSNYSNNAGSIKITVVKHMHDVREK